MRSLWLACAVVALVCSIGSACPVGECACFACSSAVTVSVFDDAGNPLNDGWALVATLKGNDVDTLGACDEANRVGNVCAFGTDAGIYRITIEAPGFATREEVVRVAAGGGDDCCNSCLNGESVFVHLEPAP